MLVPQFSGIHQLRLKFYILSERHPEQLFRAHTAVVVSAETPDTGKKISGFGDGSLPVNGVYFTFAEGAVES